MRYLLILLLLAGCIGLMPSIHVRPDGLIEHIDTQDSPCGLSTACYQLREDGSRHIYKSVLTPQWALDHEEAHDKGMHHGDYQREWDNQYCATVTASGGKYIKGQTICNTLNGEHVS